jgi:Ca2+-binding RTX toxin-like protein
MAAAIAIASALTICLLTGVALAQNLSGGKGGEKLTGTKSADTIKGRGGNDTLKGRGGNDFLDGGAGNDTLTGGKGADGHRGDHGDDTINAGDGRRDTKIFGATGIDACNIDSTLELSRVRSCETIRNAGGFSGRGPGPGQGLRVGIASGLGCEPSRPSCSFDIQGDGADGSGGDVTGIGGVNSVTGVALVVIPPENDDWVSTGGYRCSGPGALRVTIGTESVDVPVSCA